jgi:O-antigen ligase
VAATLVVIPFIASHLRWRILVIMAIVLGIIYYGNIANFSTRVEDLVANFSMDERWEIWLESIRLQQNSTGLQWLFGHGLGRFVYDYQVVSQLHGIKLYVGPHNFIMEILYSHGVLGLLVVTLLLGWFFCRLVVVTWREGAGIDKGLGMLLISVATAQFAHGFFTIPFFSRDYLLPFSFVLGAGFMYIDKSVK